MDTRSERLKKRYKQHYQDTSSTTEKQTGGWQGQTSGPTWNTWQVKQKRPPTEKTKIIKAISESTTGPRTRRLIKHGRLEASWADHFSDVEDTPPPTIEAEVQDPDTDLDMSTSLPERKGNHGSHQIPQKHGKLVRRTVQGRAWVFSTSSSATLLQQYGKRNNYLTTGRRVPLWRFQRKEPWATVTTGE